MRSCRTHRPRRTRAPRRILSPRRTWGVWTAGLRAPRCRLVLEACLLGAGRPLRGEVSVLVRRHRRVASRRAASGVGRRHGACFARVAQTQDCPKCESWLKLCWRRREWALSRTPSLRPRPQPATSSFLLRRWPWVLEATPGREIRNFFASVRPSRWRPEAPRTLSIVAR